MNKYLIILSGILVSALLFYFVPKYLSASSNIPVFATGKITCTNGRWIGTQGSCAANGGYIRSISTVGNTTTVSMDVFSSTNTVQTMFTTLLCNATSTPASCFLGGSSITIPACTSSSQPTFC